MSVVIDPQVGHPRRWSILVVCCLSLLLLVSTLTSLNVALPEIQRDLGASTADLQWIVDAYAVVFGGLLLVGGMVGDRIGRRPSLLAGLAIFGLGALIAALAGSVAIVIAGRAVSGLGGALMMPATLSIITQVFPEREVSKAIATWSGVAGGGAALGPAMGGLILEAFSWSAVFVANVVVAAIALAAAAILVPAIAPERSGRLDLVGAGWSVLALGSMLFGLIEGPSLGWTSVEVMGAFAIAVFAAGAFVRREATTPSPMLPLAVFRRRRVVIGVLTLMLGATGFVGVVFVNALLLQIGWGEGPLVAGLLLVPLGLSELVISPQSARLSARWGAGPVVATGLVMMALAYLAYATLEPGAYVAFVIIGMIGGAGNALFIPPSVDRVMSGADPELAGVTAGLNETSIELGASLGVAILGGAQRIVFDRRLPDGVNAESFDTALEGAAESVVREAYISGVRAALVVAAIASLIAVFVALRPEQR